MPYKIPKLSILLHCSNQLFLSLKHICVVFVILLFYIPVNAQTITYFESQLEKGNKRALRDVASLLDQPKIENQLRQLIHQYTSFELKNNFTRETFLNFYYENESNIHFSNLYKLFYINELNTRKVFFDIKNIETRPNKNSLSDSKTVVNRLLDIGDIESATALITKIANQHYGDETYQFFKSLCSDKRIEVCASSQRIEAYRTLCNVLCAYPKVETLTLILQLIEAEKVPPALTVLPLACISNIFTANEGSDKDLAKRYRGFLDSLKTIEALQSFGYQRFEPNIETFFFEESVDYYGYLLHRITEKEGYWWLRNNLIKAMIGTKNPRSLYYLAADMFRDRVQKDTFLSTSVSNMYTIRNVIMADVGVLDSVGKTVYEYNDFDYVAKRNLLSYWVENWNTYEWDDYKAHFVPKKIKLAEKERLERLFRRLNANNDSIATLSYSTLCESDPLEVKKLSDKYRNLLRNFNPLLPDVKKMFLDQTALFTDLCRQNQMSYQLSDEKRQLLKQLQVTTSPSERFTLEAKILKIVNFNDISAFEYWALIHTDNLNDNYSLSRLIQSIYRRYWKTIFNNKDLLTVYLKKSAIFNKIQTFGFCHQYLNGLEQSEIQKIKTEFEFETDSEIKNEIAKLLIVKDIDIEKNSIDKNKTTEIVVAIDINSKILLLAAKDSLTIDDINNIVKSNNFLDIHRADVLALLPKIRPFEDVVDLSFNPKINLKKEAKFLKNLVIAPSLLPRFARLFNTDEASEIFVWFKERVSKNAAFDQGIFWNTLLRQRWFLNFVNSSAFKIEDSKYLLNVLNFYLQNAENISEFEEQQLLLNTTILDNVGKNIKSQLETALALDIEENMKADLLNEIVAHVSYSDIAIVVPELRKLSLRNAKSPLAFLSEDFGLPIFDFDNGQDELAFTTKIATEKPISVYRHYLLLFGVNIWNKDNTLNYKQIYEILKYDLIAPYTGGGGMLRDWYVFTVIKILELTHDTRLGFHEKMNENQTFYSYNVTKRATAWLKFIEKKGLN